MDSQTVYVEVIAKFTRDGVLMPMTFTWEDGKKYRIDKVKAMVRCERQNPCRAGIMFTVLVSGKECHLFFEHNKWFVERRTA